MVSANTLQHPCHYLDDFFFAGPPDSTRCNKAISFFQSLCQQLGVPLKPEKLVLPTTCMTFLGIQLDSAAQTASIPPEKMDSLLLSLRHLYRSHRPVTKRSLIGKLSFATKVIPAGRIFLRRLLDLAHSISQLDGLVWLNHDATLDLG